SRCKETWLARPEDAVPMPAMAAEGYGHEHTEPATDLDQLAREEARDSTPIVESPSIAGDWQDGFSSQDADWDATQDEGHPRPTGWLRNLAKRPGGGPDARERFSLL